MTGTLIFFALVGVFVYAAIQAARDTLVTPGSRPGSVVEADDGSGERMNLTAFICTCDDWQRARAHFPPKAPMRLCRHLTAWFARRSNTLPEHLQNRAAMIALLASEGLGMPCGPGTEYGHLDELAYVLYVTRGSDGSERARLILGGRRYELNMTAGEWLTGPPPHQSYYVPRAVQLARTAFKKP